MNIGLTGPSSFTGECTDAVEQLLDANFVLLYHDKDEHIRHWLESVDGVILAGGIDIHPTVYGESIWNNHNLTKFDIKRDFRELAIIEYCLRHKKPMLGICRGHQLLGIRAGFQLFMDISDGLTCHNPAKSGISINKFDPTHWMLLLDPEGFYKKYDGVGDVPERKIIRDTIERKKHKELEERVWVNSFHHQALVYDPGKAKQVADEGTIVKGISRVGLKLCEENIEFMEGENWLSVQFHPEYDWKENSISKGVLLRFKKMVEGKR